METLGLFLFWQLKPSRQRGADYSEIAKKRQNKADSQALHAFEGGLLLGSEPRLVLINSGNAGPFFKRFDRSSLKAAATARFIHVSCVSCSENIDSYKKQSLSQKTAE